MKKINFDKIKRENKERIDRLKMKRNKKTTEKKKHKRKFRC